MTCWNVSQRFRSHSGGDRARVPHVCPAPRSPWAALIWRTPVMGLPVPVLDEQAETFLWDTANCFCMSLRAGWRTGDSWDFAYARTLPGYLTYTEDVRELDPRRP
jgi:hypothetical protein